METLVELRKLTVAEFHRMEFADDDPYLYELLDGELVKKKATTPRHQLILAELYGQLRDFNKQQLQPGHILFAPVDVFLDDNTGPQPDLAYLRFDQQHLITNDGIMGAPTLIVEVISPSSVWHDRVTKKRLYETFGVQEYWIIDPVGSLIEIFALETDANNRNRYELLSGASPDEGELTSGVLPGLTLDLAKLFGV